MRNFPCGTKDGNLSGRDLNDARMRNLVYVHHRAALPGYPESAATDLPLILRARPKSDAIEPRGMVVEDFIVLEIALAPAAGLAPAIPATCRGQAAEIEKATCWRRAQAYWHGDRHLTVSRRGTYRSQTKIWLDLRVANGTESFLERQSQAQQL